jgi:hypothetical protein
MADDTGSSGRQKRIAMRITAAITVLVLSGTVPSLRAQSLAEVARAQAEREKNIKPGKVYTNADLKPVPPPSADSAALSASTPAKADGAASPTADAKPTDAKVADAKPSNAKPEDHQKSEKYWSKRMRDSREQLEHDRVLADALQSHLSALTTDFVNRDDPAQRAQIGVARQKAITELEKLRQAIEADTNAIATLEEEARREGIPPGWLR